MEMVASFPSTRKLKCLRKSAKLCQQSKQGLTPLHLRRRKLEDTASHYVIYADCINVGSHQRPKPEFELQLCHAVSIGPLKLIEAIHASTIQNRFRHHVNAPR